MRIELTDNNIGKEKKEDRKNVAALFPISNKSISELCQENGSVQARHGTR